MNRLSIGGRPLLLAAVEGGDAWLAGEALAALADVNAKDSNGFTALMLAARRGNAEMAGVLCGFGADPSGRSGLRGMRSLDYPTWATTQSTALGLALQIGSVETAEVLVKNGADLNEELFLGDDKEGVWESRDRWGAPTALMWSAQAGNAEAVRMLARNGARISGAMRGSSDKTALGHALANGMETAVKTLLAAGADANEDLDSTGLKLLMQAAGNGYEKSVQSLLQAGAEVDAKRSDGWTALMFATQTGGIGVVRLLLAAGADPGQRNVNGEMAEDLMGGRNKKAKRALLTEAREMRAGPSENEGGKCRTSGSDGQRAGDVVVEEGRERKNGTLCDDAAEVVETESTTVDLMLMARVGRGVFLLVGEGGKRRFVKEAECASEIEADGLRCANEGDEMEIETTAQGVVCRVENKTVSLIWEARERERSGLLSSRQRRPG